MKKKSLTTDTPKKKSITKRVVARKTLKTDRSSTIKVEKKKKTKSWLGILVIANCIAFIAVLIINYLAVSLPIGGSTT